MDGPVRRGVADLVERIRGRAGRPSAPARVMASADRQRPPGPSGASRGHGVGRPRAPSSAAPGVCCRGQARRWPRRGGGDHQGGARGTGLGRTVHLPLCVRLYGPAGHCGRRGSGRRRTLYLRPGWVGDGAGADAERGGVVRSRAARNLPRLDGGRPARPVLGLGRGPRDALCRAPGERPPQ